MFRFLHAADIHLDSPLLNLARYEDAPIDAFRNATRQAFDNLVQVAIEERVAFVLIAGDLYDGDCRDFNTPRWFRNKMEELEASGVRAFVIQGNHDAESRMKTAFRLQLPDNVHLFGTNEPETVLIDDLQVALHGQGFATAAISEDLSAGYPAPRRGWLNIGMIHTNCGAVEGHDNYAPSSAEALVAKGYDYWALGHIHKRHVVHEAAPWIVYPGNIQGRHVNEEGAKGCTLVTVEGGRIAAVQHRELDVVRWERCDVDATDCRDAAEVLTSTGHAIQDALTRAEGRMLALRLRIVGTSASHFHLCSHAMHWQEQVQQELVDRFDDRVWLERVELRTRPAMDVDALAARDDSLGELLRGIRDMSSIEPALSAVRGELNDLLKIMPTDPRAVDMRIDLDNEEQTAAMLDDVKDVLVGRLLQSGAAS